MANKLANVPERVLTSDRPDMAHIKVKKALPGHVEGNVLYVDINSARALVGRGDADWFDPDKLNVEEATPFQVARGRANVQTMVVKSADLPAPEHPGAPEATEVVETGTGAGTVVEGPSSGGKAGKAG